MSRWPSGRASACCNNASHLPPPSPVTFTRGQTATEEQVMFAEAMLLAKMVQCTRLLPVALVSPFLWIASSAFPPTHCDVALQLYVTCSECKASGLSTSQTGDVETKTSYTHVKNYLAYFRLILKGVTILCVKKQTCLSWQMLTIFRNLWDDILNENHVLVYNVLDFDGSRQTAY